ncbi:response regulator [Neobacillus sp. MM2021_6]|uniref:response regulator n=1 Tax=Bacillaceae TaxID=186817 RepID=UPI0014096FC0|nr:response regulator [Neobacillus sp. MM2021_6]NHC18863.1 response regulator [Bacillus sp. MM2020_4]
MLRVMLIDDEEDALDLLEILLQQNENVAIVGRYTDPFQALQAFEGNGIDLVFLDIDMPGLKGTEVARKMKSVNPQLMVVFVTAYSEYAVEAFEIQSNDYLVKPVTPERLQLCISRIRPIIIEQRQSQNEIVHPYIQCMGGLYLHLPGDQKRTLSWKTKKEKEVCAFLVHHFDQPVDTDSIIEAIWPEHDLKKAKGYLYTCLSYLRKSLKESGLQVEINKIGKGFVFTANGVKSDEQLVREKLLDLHANGDFDETLFQQIHSLYKGDYMESSGYQWGVSRQIELKNLYIRAVIRRYEYFKDRNLTLAEESLQCILTMIPDSEKYARELMRIYIELGRRNAAIVVYRHLEQTINELGIELEQETVQLLKQLNVLLH